MKRLAATIMLLAFSLSLLSGCSSQPKNTAGSSSKPTSGVGSILSGSSSGGSSSGTSDTGSSGSSSAPASLKPAKNPSDGYQNYITVKEAAIQRITDIAEKSDAMSMTIGMTVLGYSMMDLQMVWLTMFTDDIKSTQMALGMFGMKDVKVTQKGGDYTMTYQDSDGNTEKQVCHFDAAKDQLASTLTDSKDKVSMFFEYVNTGKNTYAAQYYYPSDGKYQVVKMYFDKSNIAAFGSWTSDTEPSSILGKAEANEEFVKNQDSYVILKDGKLTVFDKGETSTN